MVEVVNISGQKSQIIPKGEIIILENYQEFYLNSRTKDPQGLLLDQKKHQPALCYFRQKNYQNWIVMSKKREPDQPDGLDGQDLQTRQRKVQFTYKREINDLNRQNDQQIEKQVRQLKEVLTAQS
ncbi:unnamed protein product [Paramecium primaurelia]|uniref:Uncharacterized protein n=1 Tax=Paramecium primaurelia TaxID=5886 RepID=A0A8S1QPS2_PARPR|nr:unnamed protein product [Paramecium primaurelia]